MTRPRLHERHQRRAMPGTVKTGGDSQRLWLDRLSIGPVCCAVSTDGTFPAGTTATTPGIWVNRSIGGRSLPPVGICGATGEAHRSDGGNDHGPHGFSPIACPRLGGRV
jgi:hypothetical protein